jgi:hypothetical protein
MQGELFEENLIERMMGIISFLKDDIRVLRGEVAGSLERIITARAELVSSLEVCDAMKGERLI